jgi:biotin operon repressor
MKTGTPLQTTTARPGSAARGQDPMKQQPTPLRHWTFLSNHAHVLVCLALDPDSRLRDVASSVGITERAVQKIVSDLEEAGVIVRERQGRRNSYRLSLEVPLRHPLESHRTVGTLLSLVLDRAALRRVRSA